MASGYSIVQGPRNFRVSDPLTQLSQNVETLDTTVSTIHPSGRTLFFDLETPSSFNACYLIKQIAFYTGTTTMSSLAPAVQQDKTFTLAPGEAQVFIFGSTPQKDVFGPNINVGRWLTHLYTSTTGTNFYIAAGQIYSLLDYANPTNGVITFPLNYDSVFGNEFIYQPLIAGNKTEQTITSVIPPAYLVRQNSLQLYTIIVIVNNHNLNYETITVHAGGSFEAGVRSRLETTIIPHDNPPTLSWIYGYMNSEEVNPIPGHMYLLSPGSGEVIEGVTSIANIYGGTLRFDLSSLYGTSYFPWMDNDADFSGITIQDTYDPSNSLVGRVNGWGWEGNQPNPCTEYRNFNYVIRQNYGSDYLPSINRMIIFCMTGGNNTSTVDEIVLYQSDNQGSDYWEINYNGAAPDVTVYLSLYANTSNKFSDEELYAFFKTFVDLVIYHPNGGVQTVVDMQNAFNTKQNALMNILYGKLKTDFQLLLWNNMSPVGGSGGGLQVNIASGRMYMNGSFVFGPIANGGAGYSVGDVVTVAGSSLGGVDGVNDCIITITNVDGGGQVLNYVCTGAAKYLQSQDHIDMGGDLQYNFVSGGGNYLYSNSSNIPYGDGNVQYNLWNGVGETVVDYNNGMFVSFHTNTWNSNYFQVNGALGIPFISVGAINMTNLQQYLYVDIEAGRYSSSQGVLTPGRIYTVNFTDFYYNLPASPASPASPALPMTGSLASAGMKKKRAANYNPRQYLAEKSQKQLSVQSLQKSFGACKLSTSGQMDTERKSIKMSDIIDQMIKKANQQLGVRKEAVKPSFAIPQFVQNGRFRPAK